MAATIHLDNYTVGQVLGHGAFGSVREVTDQATGEKHALKLSSWNLKKSEEEKQLAITIATGEARALGKLNSEHVVALRESYLKAQTEEFVLIIELADCGSLADLINRPSVWREVNDKMYVLILHGVLQGLAHVHSQAIVHQDVQTANVLLTSGGEVKLCDFGLSVHKDWPDLGDRFCGNPAFCSPEMFARKQHSTDGLTREAVGFPTDVWSVAMVVVDMVCGGHPYLKLDTEGILRALKDKHFLENMLEYCSTDSRDLKNFLKVCLERHPSKRPSASQALQHQVFKNMATKTDLMELLLPSPET